MTQRKSLFQQYNMNIATQAYINLDYPPTPTIILFSHVLLLYSSLECDNRHKENLNVTSIIPHWIYVQQCPVDILPSPRSLLCFRVYLWCYTRIWPFQHMSVDIAIYRWCSTRISPGPYLAYVQQCPVDTAITEVIIMLQSVSLVLHKNMALSACPTLAYVYCSLELRPTMPSWHNHHRGHYYASECIFGVAQEYGPFSMPNIVSSTLIQPFLHNFSPFLIGSTSNNAQLT